MTNAKRAASKKSAAKTILLSGLLVGSLDILVAITDHYIVTGKGPERVLRFIASGVFGQEAFTGDKSMPWMGLLFHFIIAFLFTIFFYLIYPKLKLVRVSPALTAILYGLFIWLVMNLIVVPLSNTPKFSISAEGAVKSMLILICVIGLPLSLIMKNHFRNVPTK